MANPKITSWTDGFPYDAAWADLTPKGNMSGVKTIQLPPYRVSDKALAEIEAMEREQRRLFAKDKTVFD